jgi:arylsulfatase A-like enzyme
MPLPNVPQDSEALQTWVNHKQNRYKYWDQGISLHQVRNFKAFYYAAISFVDYQIGRILSALEETGQLDNTLIVFSSDHGEYLGDYNCFGKRAMHDAASRIPMIARFPSRFPADQRCSRPTSLIDVFPTLLEAAGVKGIPSDGEDLAAVASENVSREFVFSHFSNAGTGIHMAVNEKWKYFYSLGDRREFLFDRINDPAETRNLAGNALRKKEKETMKRALLRYLKEQGRADAYSEIDGILDWKEYPIFRDPAYDDPDFGLLFQDYPSYPLSLPGYSD